MQVLGVRILCIPAWRVLSRGASSLPRRSDRLSFPYKYRLSNINKYNRYIFQASIFADGDWSISAWVDLPRKMTIGRFIDWPLPLKRQYTMSQDFWLNCSSSAIELQFFLFMISSPDCSQWRLLLTLWVVLTMIVSRLSLVIGVTCIWVWLYRSPIPVQRRGVFYLFSMIFTCLCGA